MDFTYHLVRWIYRNHASLCGRKRKKTAVRNSVLVILRGELAFVGFSNATSQTKEGVGYHASPQLANQSPFGVFLVPTT